MERVGCSRYIHFIFQSRLIAGGKNAQEGRRTQERYTTGASPRCVLLDHFENTSNCVKSLRKHNIRLVQNIGQRELCIAPADIV